MIPGEEGVAGFCALARRAVRFELGIWRSLYQWITRRPRVRPGAYGYGFGAIQSSIWQGIPWSNTVRALIDSAIYALVTGAVFWWLWPGA